MYNDRPRAGRPQPYLNRTGGVRQSEWGSDTLDLGMRISAIQSYVERCCETGSDTLNLPLALELADYVNTKRANSAREAVFETLAKINSRVPHVGLLGLQNCGYPVHLQLGTKEFLNGLVRRFPERPPMHPSPVMIKILEMIHEWRQTLCVTSKHKEDLVHIRDMHRLLMYKGYRFPRVDARNASVLNTDQTLQSPEELEEETRIAQGAKLQELIRRGTPRDLQQAQELMKIMSGADPDAKLATKQVAKELEKVQARAKLLNDMLDQAKPNEKFVSGDAYDQVASNLQSAQPRLQKWIEQAQEDQSEDLQRFLEINDLIHQSLTRYTALVGGDTSKAQKSKAKIDLISFDDEELDSNSSSAKAIPPTSSGKGVLEELSALSLGEQDTVPRSTNSSTSVSHSTLQKKAAAPNAMDLLGDLDDFSSFHSAPLPASAPPIQIGNSPAGQHAPHGLSTPPLNQNSASSNMNSSSADPFAGLDLLRYARVDARKPRSRAIRLREADLQREITHLEQELHFVEKQEQVSKLTRDLPPVDDALLEAMYHDLLESPKPTVAKRLPGESMAALDRLKLRLGAVERLASPESQDFLEQQNDVTGDASTMLSKSSQSTQDFHRAELLQRLESYVNQRQTNQDTIPTDESDQRAMNQDESGVYKAEKDASAEMLPDIPRNEWLAIALDCAQNQDIAQTIQALDLMERSGLATDSAMYTRLVNTFANHGNIDECLALSVRMQQAGILAEAPMKHAMVKAYVYGNQLGSALEYLQHWESSEPAPISAYTIATEHLLKHPVRAVHSIAWSLFYHMRFAAHPVPDVPMFALMIRACAAGVPQPNTRPARKPEADAERALDLFREMTLRHQMRPTKEVYDTLILTCARRKEFYAEAVHLVQELLDQSAANSDPSASHSLWADTYTFNALLQGSARNGDLKTARWVLAEMLRASYSSSSPRPLVNEEILSNVFWTYAVYIPPLTDRDLQSVQTSYGLTENAKSGDDQVGNPKQEPGPMQQPRPADNLEADSHALVTEQQKHGHDSDPSSKHQDVSVAAVAFTQSVPQTSQEVLGEVRALMARMLVDQSASSASLQHPFHGVPITVRILNAFLAVLMHHLPLDQQLPAVLQAIDEPTGVFHETGLEPNIHTLCLVMEAAAKSKARQEADRVVERIWSQYLSLHSSQQDPQDHINDPSTTSKIWRLYIRNLAKSYEIDRALHALRDFYQQYPPKTPDGKSKADLKSVAPSRLEALDWMPIPPKTSSLKLLSQIDGHVSPNSYQYPKLNIGRPMLRFRDLELLHHRCVALQRKDGIRLITHVDRAYTHYP
ncbi:ARF-binding protein [Malassezia yamatoensis]|uniref:ARF-binding protein n=1 Tax=Malassezia yamatoensis TaxID=253288 RepID=A0AAJ5YSV8_9BASI|nr:ARF-binding protein [Malassezia yamatoensis]